MCWPILCMLHSWVGVMVYRSDNEWGWLCFPIGVNFLFLSSFNKMQMAEWMMNLTRIPWAEINAREWEYFFLMAFPSHSHTHIHSSVIVCWETFFLRSERIHHVWLSNERIPQVTPCYNFRCKVILKRTFFYRIAIFYHAITVTISVSPFVSSVFRGKLHSAHYLHSSQFEDISRLPPVSFVRFCVSWTQSRHNSIFMLANDRNTRF